MKKIIYFLFVMGLFILSSSAIFAQTTYTSIKNGNWENSSTWSPVGVPDAGDFAIVTKSVDITGTHEIAGFELRSGTIYFKDSESPSLTITGNAFWVNGTISGGNNANNTLLVAEGSTLTFAEDPESYYFLDGGTNLINKGTILLKGNTKLYARGLSLIKNEGIFDIQSDVGFSGSTFSGGRFLNTGLLKKSGGTGISALDGWWYFENQGGTIEAQSGALEFGCGGIINGGTFNVSTGAILSFESRSYIFQGTLSGTPLGTLCVNGASIDSDSLEVTLNFKGAGFQLLRGDLTGGGTFIIPDGALLVMPGTASFYLNGGISLINRGTISKQGTNFLGIRGLSLVKNEGVFDVQSDAGFSGSTFSGGTFLNTGLLKKTGGTDVSTFTAWWTFENQGGTIDIQSGTLEFACGGIMNGGTYNASQDAQLSFASRDYLFQGTLSGTPAGLVCIDGASIDSDSLEVTLNFKGTGIQLIKGDIKGAGTFIVPEGASLILPGTASFYLNGGVSLVNRGTILKYGTTNLGIRGHSVLRNESLFDIQTDAGFAGSTFSGGTFQNAGLLKKSGGTDNTVFDGWWTLQNNTNGVIDIASGTLKISNFENVQGSIIQGTGSITVPNTFVNNGIIAPGNPAGSLGYTGKYTSSETAALNIELGGLTADSQHDQLLVTGATKLNGTLNVSLINGYKPSVGDSFVILTSTAAITDNFSAVSATPGLYLSVVINTDNVTLVVDSINSLSVDDIAFNTDFTLKQNYPNPFLTTTKISFEVQQNSAMNGQEASLIVYDLNGKQVARLLNQVLTAGKYEVSFDGSVLPEGMYFYTLRAGNFIETRKMMIMK